MPLLWLWIHSHLSGTPKGALIFLSVGIKHSFTFTLSLPAVPLESQLSERLLADAEVAATQVTSILTPVHLQGNQF